MTPVLQTIHGWPDGNCFQACLASIFDLPLDDAPHVFKGAGAESEWTQEQWNAVLKFANSHGRTAHWIDPDTEQLLCDLLKNSGLYYIATGPSPNGKFGHCVVMRRGIFVHDPTGTGKFLAGDPWLFIVFDLPRCVDDETH